MIDEGDGTLQKRFDNGLCPFCQCQWQPDEDSRCKFCNRAWVDHKPDKQKDNSGD